MLFNSPLSDEIFQNPDQAYPNLAMLELLAIVRVNKATGRDIIQSKVIEAMDTINRQLSTKNLSFPLDTNKERYYKRAVAYEAAALIGEDSLDYDTTSDGQIRGENGLIKTQSLRRNVDYAIADITGKPRQRIRLI